MQFVVDRFGQGIRKAFSNETVYGVEYRTVLDAMQVRLKERVLDGVFTRAHLQAQVHGRTVATPFREPDVRARLSRVGLDVPNDGVASLAFVLGNEHGDVRELAAL